MKHSFFVGLSILCLSLSWSTFLAGQNGNEQNLVTVESLERAPTPVNSKAQKRVIPKIRDIYRHHNALPETFDGTIIELTTSDFPLQRDYHLFRQFGQVYYDRIKDRGYSYGIITNFSSEQALRKYLEQVIKPKAPEAKLVEYRKGKRIEK